jgi:hypothetical protein
MPTALTSAQDAVLMATLPVARRYGADGKVPMAAVGTSLCLRQGKLCRRPPAAGTLTGSVVIYLMHTLGNKASFWTYQSSTAGYVNEKGSLIHKMNYHRLLNEERRQLTLLSYIYTCLLLLSK